MSRANDCVIEIAVYVCLFFYYWLLIILPCDETALDRAKSILFATIMMGRVRIKSKSCSDINSCSTRVYDALSTHEYTKMNASALMYSSYNCKQWKCQAHTNTHVSMQLIASVRTNQEREAEKSQESKVKMKIVFDCLKNMKWCKIKSHSNDAKYEKKSATLLSHTPNLIFILRAITLVPFWPMMNFISDSTPFKTTDTFCSTVDSRIDAQMKKTRKWNRKLFSLYFWIVK